MTAPDTRVLASVSLDGMAGGVAAASRLCWRVMRDRWGGDARLVTLNDQSSGVTAVQKVKFGARLLGMQVLGDVRWVLFSHLGLARAQARIPAHVHRPYAVFLHGVEVWRDLPESDLQVLRGAALRLANSEFTARRVMTQHPSIGSVYACQLALSPDDELAAQHADLNGPREPLVLMVGRMDAGEGYKGHAQAIAAWPQVLATCPNARLVLVGEGNDVERLRGLAARAGVAHAVEFPGFVARNELQDLYRRASVYLMPSRGEGFGLVYLEAMAHALPCIGSRHDAAGDIIVDGTTGYFVNQDDTGEIAARVTMLVSDAALARRMGAAGQQRWHHAFSFDQFSERLVGLLERHLDRGSEAAVSRTAAVGSGGSSA